MIYLDLILGFLRVGTFAFGGVYGAIPIIRDVVLQRGWLTDDELAYMIAISESTPGAITVNLATYIGSTKAGFWGGLLATAAVVLPSFIIILLIMVLFKKLLGNRYFQSVIGALKPCVTGIILATGIYMTFSRIIATDNPFAFDIKALILTAILGTLMFGSEKLIKKKLSPVLLILFGAAGGILIY